MVEEITYKHTRHSIKSRLSRKSYFIYLPIFRNSVFIESNRMWNSSREEKQFGSFSVTFLADFSRIQFLFIMKNLIVFYMIQNQRSFKIIKQSLNRSRVDCFSIWKNTVNFQFVCSFFLIDTQTWLRRKTKGLCVTNAVCDYIQKRINYLSIGSNNKETINCIVFACNRHNPKTNVHFNLL